MDTTTLPAVAALVVGVIGLIVCVLAMSHSLPARARSALHTWHRWRRSGGLQLDGVEPDPRRVVTGVPAADRLSPEMRPARHPAMRPDVLRRERERLSTEEARRVVARFVDDDPGTLAGVVDHWLAQDRDTTDRRDTSRRRGRT